MGVVSALGNIPGGSVTGFRVGAPINVRPPGFGVGAPTDQPLPPLQPGMTGGSPVQGVGTFGTRPPTEPPPIASQRGPGVGLQPVQPSPQSVQTTAFGRPPVATNPPFQRPPAIGLQPPQPALQSVQSTAFGGGPILTTGQGINERTGAPIGPVGNQATPISPAQEGLVNPLPQRPPTGGIRGAPPELLGGPVRPPEIGGGPIRPPGIGGGPILPPPGPAPATPQVGLLGGEAAFLGAAGQGARALRQGTQQGLGTLLGGFNLARQSLGQGIAALGGGFDVGGPGEGGTAGGFRVSPIGMGSGGGGTGVAIAQAAQLDPLTGQPLFREAAEGVGAFTGAGLSAQQRLAALTGALGQEAFDLAMIDDPNQRLLNERAQQALINQQAATGAVGSGQTLIELQQLGQAQAAQDVQRQIQNLTGLSQQGLAAAGQAGQFLGQAGSQQGQLAGQRAQLGTQVNLSNAAARNQAALQAAQLSSQERLTGAQLASRAALQSQQLGQQARLASASNRLQAAQAQAGLFGQQAGLAAGLAGQGAGFQQQTGRDISNLLSGLGGRIGEARIQAGRDLSSQIGATTGQLSGLQSQGGINLSNLIGSGALNVSNLLAGAGQAASAGNQQLATLLSNLAIGAGTNQANLALQGGQTAAQLALAQGGNQQQLIANLLAAAQQGGAFDENP